MLSNAQFKFEIKPFFSYFGDLRRYELGGNYAAANGVFNGVIPVYGYNNKYLGDSTMKRSLKSSPGFGASLGLAIPIISTGHISLIAVSIHAMYNQYNWNDVNQGMNVDGSFKDAPKVLNAVTQQIALPFGLDWKVGCDAICTKRLILGADVGVGAVPHLNLSSIPALSDVNAQQSFGLNPYVKGEVAFFLGMCVRVRAMYTMGNVELLNIKSQIPGYTDGPFRITNNSNMMVSFIIMPFSGKWHESAWYNDYDSYNWNEHLN